MSEQSPFTFDFLVHLDVTNGIGYSSTANQGQLVLPSPVLQASPRHTFLCVCVPSQFLHRYDRDQNLVHLRQVEPFYLGTWKGVEPLWRLCVALS